MSFSAAIPLVGVFCMFDFCLLLPNLFYVQDSKKIDKNDDDDDEDEDEDAMDMEAFEESGMLEEKDNVSTRYYHGNCYRYI